VKHFKTIEVEYASARSDCSLVNCSLHAALFAGQTCARVAPWRLEAL
jgi:hypothetical protein